jgi:hypothetical protein
MDARDGARAIFASRGGCGRIVSGAVADTLPRRSELKASPPKAGKAQSLSLMNMYSYLKAALVGVFTIFPPIIQTACLLSDGYSHLATPTTVLCARAHPQKDLQAGTFVGPSSVAFTVPDRAEVPPAGR